MKGIKFVRNLEKTFPYLSFNPIIESKSYQWYEIHINKHTFGFLRYGKSKIYLGNEYYSVKEKYKVKQRIKHLYNYGIQVFIDKWNILDLLKQ